jgi:bacterioferritin-associated ferredoxin
MFVCICRAVSQSRIRAAIDAGATSVDEVEACCGAGGDCGACREEIEGIIIEARSDRCASCPNARGDIPAHRAA